MTTYKIIVAYDGTQYAGWQMQKHTYAIANILQDIFYKTFKTKIHLIAASRTDAGVHAHGQVATFSCNLEISCEKLLFAWNNVLPNDIVVRSLNSIADNFHARFDVTQKIYWYHFFLEQPLPPYNRFGIYIKKSVNLALLQEALQLFDGKHDFRSFASDSSGKNSLRTIDEISLDFNEQLQAYRIVVKGKSFLHCMIRRMVGAAFEAGLAKTTIANIQKILEAKNPNHALPTAPAHGLILHEIHYKS